MLSIRWASTHLQHEYKTSVNRNRRQIVYYMYYMYSARTEVALYSASSEVTLYSTSSEVTLYSTSTEVK